MRSAYRWVGALAAVIAFGVVLLALFALLGRAVLPDRTAAAQSGTDEGVVVRVVGVVDGDTLRVSVDGVTERLRIIGIDAPELRGGECLAQEAASHMQRLAQSQSVRIAEDSTQADRDVYDRILRHVWLLDGRSVGIEMLTAGLATEYTYDAPYVGVEDHVAAEDEARAAGRGLWGAGCDGRAAESAAPGPGAALAEEPEGCEIKGNINAEGERIYHVPGQRFYAQTRIDPTKGERWFCTEQEALDAGWRRART
ncbi:MAG: thermonuclease family protein [Dermatophilaceae bacterium]|nr:thermonuclease family protein [Intrasporangiaceae bacterium]